MAKDNQKILSDRKKDHIDLAFLSQTIKSDPRFYYEPLLSGHPTKKVSTEVKFKDFTFGAPLWISSMTGGTSMAATINHRLAKIAGEFSLGMGLGSCRSLLESEKSFEDFNVKKYMPNSPLLANLGIAQIETLLKENKISLIYNMVEKLKCDGLIIHINPLQEWHQDHGDHFERSPLETIKEFLEGWNLPLVVKEVGQGMGPGSLKELMKLPLAAIEFSAFGGTNFTKVEAMRNSDASPFESVGHTASEMVGFVSENKKLLGGDTKCVNFIISGGIKSFLDGHYLMEKLPYSGIYGQASELLKYALRSEEELREYVQNEINGLRLAKSYLYTK